MEYDRYIINDDRVTLSVENFIEPHPLSPHGDNDFGYQVMKNSIRQVWTDAVVAPGALFFTLCFLLYVHILHVYQIARQNDYLKGYATPDIYL